MEKARLRNFGVLQPGFYNRYSTISLSIISLISLFPFLKIFLPEHNQLRQQAYRQRREKVHCGVLLYKHGGETYHNYCKHHENLPEHMGALFSKPHGANADGISHVEGGADAGVGVEAVDEGHAVGQEIVAGEHHRAQVLSGGENNVAGHGYNLGDDDKDGELFKIIYIVQSKIAQGKYNQQIPEAVGNNKCFMEGNPVIDDTVDGVTILHGNQIFCQIIEDEIHNPSQQEKQVGELRVSQFGQTELTVINNWFSHKKISFDRWLWLKQFSPHPFMQA